MTFFDLIVLGVIGLSAFFAMVRGFMRELAFLLALALAGLASIFGSGLLRPLARGLVPQPWLADIIVFAGIFIIIYLLISTVLGSAISRMREQSAGTIDRVLGFVFGAARGFLLVVIGYYIYSVLQPMERHPDSVKSSFTYPVISSVTKALLRASAERALDEDE